MAAPFEQFTRKENAPVSTGAPFEQFTKQETPPATVSSDYEKQFPADIDIPPQNATPADWYSPQQKAARRQAYLLTQKNKAPEDTLLDKIRAGIEAGGGTITTAVSSVPGIPYGLYNALKNQTAGNPADTENEIFKAINAVTPNILMPHSALGQQYMENIGTALQAVPAFGGEAAVIGETAPMAAQFAKAKAGTITANTIERAANVVPLAEQFSQAAGSGTKLGGTAKIISAILSRVANNAPNKQLTIKPVSAFSADNNVHNTNYELHAKIADAENNGTINPVVARRHIEAESLPSVDANGNPLFFNEKGDPIKMQLTQGAATRDSKIWSDEMNNRANNPQLRQVMSDNAEVAPQYFDYFKKQVAPDLSFETIPERGDFLINKIFGQGEQLKNDIRAKYKAVYDAADQSGSGQIPLDYNAFVNDAMSRLEKQRLTRYLPNNVKAELEDIKSGAVPMDMENYMSLDKILSAEHRFQNKSPENGSAATAVGIVRDALTDIPLSPGMEHLMPLYNEAKSAARFEKQLREDSPAYKAVMEGTARPDDFVKNYILGQNKNVGVNELKTLNGIFQGDKEWGQALAEARLEDIKKQSLTSNGKVSSPKLNTALENGQQRGLDEMFLPLPIRDSLDNLNKVMEYTTVAPTASYVQGNPHIISRVQSSISSGLTNAIQGGLNIVIPGAKAGTRLAEQYSKLKNKITDKSTDIGAGLDYPYKK